MQLTRDEWDGCQEICLALLHTGRNFASAQPSLPALPFQVFASGCAVLCLRHGDPAWFRLGAAALSLQLHIQPDWRDLAGTAAALRFALDHTGLDRLEILAEAPNLEEAIRRLLTSSLPAERFGLSIHLTPAGLDLQLPSGNFLSEALPAR